MNERRAVIAVLLGLSILPAVSRAQPRVFVESPQIAIKPAEFTLESAKSVDLAKLFEMEDPNEAASELREHVAKYGISLDVSETARPQFLDVKKSIQDQNRIRLPSGREFVPAEGTEAELMANLPTTLAKSDAEARSVCILQFRGNLTLRELLELLEAGVKFYDPIGSNSIIVRLPASSVLLLASRPFVRWIGAYKSEYKYAENMSTSGKPGAFIYPFGGDKPEYRNDLNTLGVTIRSYDPSASFYDVILNTDRFDEIADRLWWVKTILKDSEDQLEWFPRGLANITVNFEPDDSRQLIMAYDDNSLTGSGVTVGIRDDAVYEIHSELSGIFHSDSELGGTEVHGTHVAGIIAGRTKSITGPWGNSTISGVARSASVLFRKNAATSWDWVPWVESYSSDFSSFRNNGVQISNHSYLIPDANNNIFFGYDGHSSNFDAYCDNDDMIIVKSAGNQQNPRTITNPGTAKNVIAVGAINFVSSSVDVIGAKSESSSQGPTQDDGRLKPELVAPGGGSSFGEGVVSTSSDPWDADGISGNINGVHTWPEWESDDNYIRLSGTSMAAPHVTGVLAKMKQWGSGLHSEVMKALLINTTIPIKASSSDALGAYANTQVGYGMVNGFSITSYYEGESERLLFGEGRVTEDEKEQDWTINVSSGTKRLIVTLAYNDQEGEASESKALKDDLDLILISPSGTRYYAYQHKATGVTSESPLEKMVITNPQTGTWTVRVQFVDSPGFGNLFIYADQRYGVVAHAIYKTPSLTLTVPQTTISVSPGQEFDLQPTVKNSGGYIAAGITVKASGAANFGGNINRSRYVGNLLHQNASVSLPVTLVAPQSPGSYTVTIEADGINREFVSSYPKTVQVNVNVLATRTLDVTSLNPNSGVSIVVSPNDKNGLGGGVTQFTRVFDDNIVVTLTAPSNAGSNNFIKWQRNGVDHSSSFTTQVTMNSDYMMRAVYGTPTQTLTVTSSNPNSGVAIAISPNDNNGLGSGTTQLTRVYNKNTSVSLTASSSISGKSFQKWQRNGVDYATNLNTTVTMDDNYTMTVVYVNDRTLTIKSSNPGTGVPISVSPNDKTGQGNGTTEFVRVYAENSSVTVTAPVDAGNNNFQKWQRNGIDWSTSRSTNLTMDADYTITAVFAGTPACYTISTKTNPAASGTIAVNTSHNCSGGYLSGTSLSLTANPSTGYTFSKWSGSGGTFETEYSSTTTFILTGDATITANFAEINSSKTLTIGSVNPNSTVNIVVSPNDNNGLGDGSTPFVRTYNNNAEVTITAPSAASGNNFQKWFRNGIAYQSTPTVLITMDADYSLTAVYESQIPQLQWEVAGSINLTELGFVGHIAVGGGKAYVSRNGGRVIVIDLSNNSEVANIQFPTYPSAGPKGIAVSENRAYVALNTGSDGHIGVVNTENNSVLSYIPVGVEPFGVSILQDKVYVTNNVWWTNGDPATVRVIDINSNSVISTIPVGIEPTSVAVDPLSRKVFVTNSNGLSKSVSVVNTATNTVVATIPMQNEPHGVAITDTKAYVSNKLNYPSGTVEVIDIGTNSIIASIPVGRDAVGVAALDGYVFVANQSSNTVSIINSVTDSVVSTLNVGNTPTWIAVDELTKKVYVTNQSYGTISIIQPKQIDPGVLTISSSNWTAPALGGTSVQFVVSNSSSSGVINYVILDDSDWLTTSASEGSTPDSFTVTALPNNSGAQRTGIVTVTAISSAVMESPKTIIVTQDSQTSSLAGTKIAFASKRDGNTQIYIMDVDGSNQTRITNNLNSDFDPSWSPDGSKLLFVSDRDGNNEIYIMNHDGTEQVRLTTSSVNEDYPRFSSDGSKIAYISNGDIWVMDSDGGNQVKLTDNGNLTFFNRYPAWSPDGTKIAFESTREGKNEIWTMNVDGSNQTQLTALSVSPVSLSWYPHTSKLTFHSSRDGNPEIYTVDSDGSNLMRLTNNSATDGQPAWSPDGSKIVFYSFRDGNAEIYSMNADGSDQTRLTNSEETDFYASWSPVPVELPTYSLTGRVTYLTEGLGGVAINLAGAEPASTITDENGDYEFTGLPNGQYDVAPYNEGFYFTPNNYEISLSGSSATEIDFVATLIVLPPITPTLLLPPNSTAGISVKPTFEWNSSPAATAYRLQISNDLTFATTVFDDSTIADTSKQVGQLEGETVYFWRVSARNTGGESPYSEMWSFATSKITSVERVNDEIPTSYELGQNYPNPFNPSTSIPYQIAQHGYVSLQVYNLLGEVVGVLVDQEQEAGYYVVKWLPQVPSGIYFYRLQTQGGFVETRKLILLR